MNPVEGPAGDFWRFSVEFYGRPGIANACLDLQDGHGADINLLLFACWVGISGRGRLAAPGLARADAALAPWRDAVIAPLRGVRKFLKNDRKAIEFYGIVKATELEAEHIAQDRLEALAPIKTPADAEARRADALANLALYLGGGARFAAAAEAIRSALQSEA